MRHFILQLIFGCFLSGVFAQNGTGVDTTLKFNKRYTKCERKWVVLSKKDSSKEYLFGFIYLDSEAGFTFDLQGSFSIDKNNKYITDTTKAKDRSVKVRLIPNWQRVALMSPDHYRELKIKPEPDWIKNYYTYTDTVAHYYRWGWFYNDLDESEIALVYLKQAYQIKQHAPGVEFEMAYAYNVLKQYDAAIGILAPALQNKPNEALFYKELAFAYSHKRDFDSAISTYKKGLEYFPDKPSDAKGEMAFNMAGIYKEIGNMDEYKNWMIKAKLYVLPDSIYYKRIVDAGF
jgi:tetratricopeptide (TPR) repeat protein